MIQTLKILSGKYDTLVSPTLTVVDPKSTRGHHLRLQKIELNMIYPNFASLTESLILGTHYLVMQYVEQVIIVLRIIYDMIQIF